MLWTPDRTDLLKKLWADGVSISQIAAELGVSRSTIAGKVKRLKLAKRRQETSMIAAQKRQRKPKPKRKKPGLLASCTIGIGFAALKSGNPQPPPPLPPEPETPTSIIPIGQRCTIMDLDDHPALASKCRWPMGDPRDPDFFFCGGKTVTGLSYCGCHAEMAYRGMA